MTDNNEKPKKKKEFYDPTTRIDEVSPARKNLLMNFANRDPNDMLRYYLTRYPRIEEYHDKVDKIGEIKKKLDKLMDDDNTTLGTKRLEPKIFLKYYKLIDMVGEVFDEYGFLKDKYHEKPKIDLSQIQKIYQYDTLFNFIDDLFEPGNDNIMYGAKGDGKSNFALNLAMEGIKKNYIFATNIGIKKDHPYKWINDKLLKCTWMTELLRIVADNKIRNMAYKKNGYPLNCRYVVAILDEGESFMQSISRKSDKDVADFNKFNQLTRKLDLSITWIFHRYEDVPKTFRVSPNLNAKILKGLEIDGTKTERPKEKAIIEFVGQNYQVNIDGIPKNEILDTFAMSGFDIYNEKFLDKSVDLTEVFQICKDTDSDKVPHAILRYLDNVKLENQPIENLIQMSNRVYDEVKNKILNCNNKTEFYTIAKKLFQEKYKLADISIVKNAEKALKNCIYDEWELFKIQQREEKEKGTIQIHPDKINPTYADFELLKIWVNKYDPKMIRAIVDFKYRKVDENEILELYNFGISKNKIVALYGNPAKEYVFSLKTRANSS
ncbi:MAG: hypothetical protein E3J52_10395 [Promethearchaeota archaeon]|nr:MAG: hypothetical protein E3J52_10395 [Candidatus Lokiarchaeota archaeon]